MRRENNYKRILITGNAGAGKSTFAVALADVLQRDLLHFDSLIWKANWQFVNTEERRQAVQQILASEEWIVDGVSKELCQAADLIIFFDLPRWYCLYHALRRSCRNLFRTRPGFPEGCQEYKVIFKLVKIIWKFPRLCVPSIKACQPSVVFKSRKRAWQWLDQCGWK